MSDQLFIGRLPRTTRSRDLEDIFYRYGRMTRCDVKQGEHSYIFKQFLLLFFFYYNIIWDPYRCAGLKMCKCKKKECILL